MESKETLESVCSEEELQSIETSSESSGETLTSCKKSRKDAFTCSCAISEMESANSSDTESVTSNASSVVSFIIVPDVPTRTKNKCCLKRRLWSVFNNERLSDVVFIVGSGEEKQRIPAHKVLLSVGSDVFNNMFSENRSSEFPEIEVPDVEPSAFTALLRFLYTDDVAITSDNVIAVLYAAKKYAVQPLENLCVDFLVARLTPKNAFSILNQVISFNDQRLINPCLEMIDSDTVEAVAAEGFLDVDAKTLCLVLERNTLTISEIQLFDAVHHWSEVECLKQNLPVNSENKRSMLEESLPLLRFPLMSVEKFASTVPKSGLLTNEELLSISLYFLSQPKPSITFNSMPRFYTEFFVNRFKAVENGFACQGRWDGIDFTCDQNVHLLGIGLYGSLNTPASYDVTITLKDTASDCTLHKAANLYEMDYGVAVIYKAFFKKPIKITAFTTYTVCSSIKGPDSFYGKNGMENVSVDLPHGRTVTVSFGLRVSNKTLLTRVDQGQIPELIFST